MARATYIHGTEPFEQARLAKLGVLTDASYIRFLELDGARSILEVGSGLGNLTRLQQNIASFLRKNAIGIFTVLAATAYALDRVFPLASI